MSAPVTFRLEPPTFDAAGCTWVWHIGVQAWVAHIPSEDCTLKVWRVTRGVYEAQDGTRFETPHQAAQWSHYATFNL